MTSGQFLANCVAFAARLAVEPEAARGGQEPRVISARSENCLSRSVYERRAGIGVSWERLSQAVGAGWGGIRNGATRAFCCWALLCCIAGLVVPVATAAGVSDSATLHRVAEEYFDWRTRNDSLSFPPLDTISRIGTLPAMPDVSEENARRVSRQAQAWLRELAGVSEANLAHDDQLSLAVLRWDLRNYGDSSRFYWLDFPIGVYGTRLSPVHDILRGFSFDTPGDVERYLGLIHGYPKLIDAMTAKMRGQMSRSIVMPAAELEVSRAFIASLVTVPTQSLFYVAPERLTALAPDLQARLQHSLLVEIEQRINPALSRMLVFLDGDYKRRAPTAVGVGQYPDGPAYYRWLVRFHTTMEVAPTEVHQRGLAELAKAERQLAALAAELHVDGGLEALHAKVMGDPNSYARTPEEVGERLLGYLRRIEPVIPAYFSTIPRAPYTVRRLRPESEGGMTFGYYQDPAPGSPSGIYWYNGSALDQRPMFWAGALIYHEIVPGHHMQHAIQAENACLPKFRRYGGSNAFDEGWATYASTVASDMGMYADPYDRLGLIANDLMVATRLVVDTGMNALGWSRERARKFIVEHTFTSQQQSATETLRYSSDIPGQSLAYAMVSLKLRAIREHERRALGAAFDIRQFHDAVLLPGALPMPVLESHVHWYLRAPHSPPSCTPNPDPGHAEVVESPFRRAAGAVLRGVRTTGNS